MAKKKAPAKKPKNYAKLSQKEKFMAAAQEFEAEQTGETFFASFKAIAKHKPGSAKILDLHVFQNGKVRFGDGPQLSPVALRAKIKALMLENPRPHIRILPSVGPPHDAVAKVLQSFQQMGYGPHFGISGVSE